MSNRKILVLILIGAALLIAALLLRSRPPATPAGEAESDQTPATQVAQSANVPSPSNAPAAPTLPGPISTSTPNKSTEIKEGLATLNDVPIVFYGKLQDQFGNPVAGATVVGDVLIYNGKGPAGQKITTTSDASGFFQMHGDKGESLGVWPTKTGYVIATTETEFKYSFMYPNHITPDQNNPVVIKMWKLQGAQSLLQINQRFKIPYTSAPLRFDFVSGSQVATGGDLVISVNRPDGAISQQNPQNWGLHIDAVDGGIVIALETDARVTYGAPNDGYKPGDTFQNNNGPDLVDQMLFVKSRNGQIYSKVHILFRINNTPDSLMNITLKGVANTNASGNWEGDPNTVGAMTGQ
jgi:hypothetical protein